MFDSIRDLERNTEKVGTLLDPFSGNSQEPTALWLCEIGVPIWYRWEHHEENFIIYGHFGHLKYLRPPVELLQSVITFLVRNPPHTSDSEQFALTASQPILETDLQLTRPLHTAELLYQLRDAHIKTKPWEHFFTMLKLPIRSTTRRRRKNADSLKSGKDTSEGQC